MKKVFMMAIALMVCTMSIAKKKSDALKAVMDSKNYAEAVQLLKVGLDQMTDNEEKAEAYNHLVDLAMKKVSKETTIISSNDAYTQLKQTDKIEPYDTIGLGDAICNAIEAAIECDKYDKMPNAKGKIKPQFAEDNSKRVWAVCGNLINIGQAVAQNNETAVLKYWGAFTDAEINPFFANEDHNRLKEYVGQVAFFAGHYAIQAKDMERANRYLEIAKKDPTQKEKAQNLQLYALSSSLKNHEDSVLFVNQLKQMYEQDPENVNIFSTLNGMYEGMKDKTSQSAFIDAHLDKYPGSYIALASKGTMAMNENNAAEGAKWLRKAADAKPDNAAIWTYLGMCLNALAATASDNNTSMKYFDDAIIAFDKAKELDPNKQMANWGYNRYQSYYGRYGADDPKTKAAEADR